MKEKSNTASGFLQLDRNYYSFLTSIVSVLVVAFLFSSGCSITKFPSCAEQCKIRTFINNSFSDYVRHRYLSTQPVRIAVIPFDVPETFAGIGAEGNHYGRTLAISFVDELLRSGEMVIVELLDRDRWPGKRAEFSAGNYNSIMLARNAGYDLVLVGSLEDLKNESDLNLNTKIIDTENSVTIWYARTEISSSARSWRRGIDSASYGLFPNRPELFQMNERKDLMVKCTVENIYNNPLSPKEEEEQEALE